MHEYCHQRTVNTAASATSLSNRNMLPPLEEEKREKPGIQNYYICMTNKGKYNNSLLGEPHGGGILLYFQVATTADRTSRMLTPGHKQRPRGDTQDDTARKNCLIS